MVAARVGVSERAWRKTQRVGFQLASDREHGLTERMTPAEMLDQALTLLRHATAAQWLRGVSAGLPLAAVLLALYAFVHVVGVRPPLALFGLLCALAYWSRFRGLSRLARELVFALHPSVQTGGRAGSLGGFNTAMVAGMGSWFWAVALLAAAQSSLTVLLVCFPLLCARGAFAPSLLARSACAPESGLRALARASADTRGQRYLFLGVELLALLGLLLVFGNVYALTALALLVASSVLGLDVGFVTALIAPDNEIVPLLLLGVATLMLEPLRAAVSALAFQRARERWEGADLHAAISALPAEPRRRESMPPKAAASAVLVLLALLAPTITHAEPPNLKTSDAQGREAASEAARDGVTDTAGEVARDVSADVGATDERARERARAILARDEFLPSSMDSAEGSWRKWLAERMRDRELSDRDASAPPRFELRLPSSILVLGSVLLLSGVGFWLMRSLHRKKARAAASGTTALPTSDERIAEASSLAERQQFELGLRSLYAACLSALGLIDSAQTNGQVLQRIQSPPLRAAFAHLTRVIEPYCYGQQRATREDFEHARALTAQILHEVTAQRAAEVRS
jgi:hypothetical protein